jgi:integrase
MALRQTTGESTMAGMRNFQERAIDLMRQSFGGRYALRDRCYFEVALQTGLRVSELLSITVGQVYQYGKVVEELSIDRKHMKGGKAGKAGKAVGRTLPIFDETKPHILTWLQRLAAMLQVDVTAIPPETPLFMSRVHHPDGSRCAIARETAWCIIKGLARENELSGKIGNHSTRKTLARRAKEYAERTGIEDPMHFVQRILGHKSISSTEAYYESITEEEAWQGFRSAMQPTAA